MHTGKLLLQFKDFGINLKVGTRQQSQASLCLCLETPQKSYISIWNLRSSYKMSFFSFFSLTSFTAAECQRHVTERTQNYTNLGKGKILAASVHSLVYYVTHSLNALSPSVDLFFIYYLQLMILTKWVLFSVFLLFIGQCVT